MSNLKINSLHIAGMLACKCFGYQPAVRAPRERLMQSADAQQAKLQAARGKRQRKQLKRVQEGH